MADNGNNRLDLAFTRSEETATSLRHTAQRMQSLEETVARLAAAAAQQTASAELIRSHSDDGARRLESSI